MKKGLNKVLKVTGAALGMIAAGGIAAGVKEHFDNKKNDTAPGSIYEDGVKRGLDFVCGASAMIFLSPLYLGVAGLVRLKLGSPVIFTQMRPGKIDPKTGEEKIFKLYKFRTMTDERDENGDLLPDKDRLTGFGAWLRSTSLDELPEAINIVKGDMSVVGPRPLLVRYISRYSEGQRKRHLVRPGLTGYAQAHGRNAVSWEDRFDMDVWYIENISLREDLRIIADTIRTVLNHEGISSGTSETMEEFMGNS